MHITIPLMHSSMGDKNCKLLFNNIMIHIFNMIIIMHIFNPMMMHIFNTIMHISLNLNLACAGLSGIRCGG